MIDFLSDTVTQPTQHMRNAMYHAQVGDDVYGEDPTVTELESMAAAIVGSESAAFVSSGTLGNLTSLLSHCPRGKEVILGDNSDVYNYECGGASVAGGCIFHPVKTERDGTLLIENIKSAIRDEFDYQCASAGALVLENPHCLSGGRVLPIAYLQDLQRFAKEQNLPVHMDGARLFNAAVALNIPAKEIVQYVDSVQFCLSKSLAAPFGSMVCGSKCFIDKAKRYRKLFGGGLRQAGFMAAAGIVALTSMVDRLYEDHQLAKYFAEQIKEIDEIELLSDVIETNMVFFNVRGNCLTNTDLLTALRADGVRMGLLGDGMIRAVTHYMLTSTDVDLTIRLIKKIVKVGK